MNDVAPKDRHIAMVFQNYALYPHMSVYDNMSFGLKLKKVPKDEIEKKIVIDELQKKYKEGDVVGKCEIYLNNEKIGEVTIYCDRNIKKGNVFSNIKYNVTHLFGDKEKDNCEEKDDCK